MGKMVIFIIMFLAVPFFASAGVFINEVLFDPQGIDTGLEWIEIYNSGNISQDLSGWSLYPDGVGYFSFPAGFMILPGNFVVVRLRASGNNSSTELYDSLSSTNMGNTSGSAALFSGEPRGKDTLKSFVEWGKGGKTWESASADSGLWTKATPVNLSAILEGNSIMLIEDGKTEGGAGAWKISAEPGPGAANNKKKADDQPLPDTSASSSESQSQIVLSPSSPPPSSVIFFPEMHAYAGSDQEAAVGALVSFLGYATISSKNELAKNTRFWWNFGDGESREGKSVTHAFPVLGTYTVGLHVSTDIYSVSDYLTVRVVPNRLSITGVIDGENGFFRLYNKGDSEVDIGGWVAEDQDAGRFAFPMKTKIAENADVAFSNGVTGILRSKADRLTLYYPNGLIALEWNKVLQGVMAVVSKDFVAATATEALRPVLKSSSVPASSSVAAEKIPENLAASGTGKQVAAISAAPRFFFIGALIFSALGAVFFLIFKRF